MKKQKVSSAVIRRLPRYYRHLNDLYLAGVEVADEAEAPAGWVKCTIPGYEYLYVKCTQEDIFGKVLEYMEEQGIELAGAVHDFNCPEENGQGYAKKSIL